MSVALDANAVIYLFDATSPHHSVTERTFAQIVSSGEPVWLFPTVIVAFLRVTTHPRLSSSPLSLEQAFEYLDTLLALPNVTVGFPDDAFVEQLRAAASLASAGGNLIHDAEIVALMQQHGIEGILTADRDFLKFAGTEVRLLTI